jgi:hypothetical protein
MVSPYEPAVEAPQHESPEPEPQSPDPESPEMARAKQLAAAIDSLEQTLDPKPRSISGKRHSQRLADSRQLLQSRIESIPDFERHSRKCQVCHSRYVEEIEEAYYNWSSAQWIINVFNISYDDAVYRHARAIGLDLRRRKNVAIAVEKLIEKVDEVTVTSSTILRAVRALSCLTPDGRWTDLPTTHIVLTNKDLPKDTSVTATPSTEAGSTSSTERTEPLDGRDSAATASTNDADSMTSSSFERSEPASTSANPENVGANSFTSFERSEITPRQGTASAVPNTAASSGVSTPEASASDPESAARSVTSTERSDPFDGRDSASTADLEMGSHENESVGTSFSSFERSEPIRASDITIPENVPFSKIEPRASSFESLEPNRGTMKN